MDVSIELFCLPYLLVGHSPSNSPIKKHKIELKYAVCCRIFFDA